MMQVTDKYITNLIYLLLLHSVPCVRVCASRVYKNTRSQPACQPVGQPVSQRRRGRVWINKAANKSRANKCSCILFGTVANAASARDEYILRTPTYTRTAHIGAGLSLACICTVWVCVLGMHGWSRRRNNDRSQNKTNRKTHMNHYYVAGNALCRPVCRNEIKTKTNQTE